MEYIKIPRNIIEQTWYRNANARNVFLHLLLTVDEDGKTYICLRKLAEETNITLQKLRTALEHLADGNIIIVLPTQKVTQSATQSATRYGQCISICNFDSYRVSKNEDNTKCNTINNTNINTNEEKNKTKKEEIPPHPPIEEKNKTKKEDFTENQRFSTTKNVCVCACEGQDGISGQEEPKAPPKAPLIDKRREEFRISLEPYEQKYGKEMCENFFNYWSEYNRSRTKMRCELQKTWQLSGRLATWAKNDYRVNQPSTVYVNTTNSRYSSADNAERERLERQRSAYRLMQRLAAEDGGDPLPPLEQ